MIPPFGMAGLAEGAFAMALAIGMGGLLLVGLTASIAVLGRSRIAATIALILISLITAMFTPWEAFRPYESDDPDFHHWMSAARGFAWWWAVTVAGTVIAAAWAFGFRPKPVAPNGPQAIRKGIGGDRRDGADLRDLEPF